MSTANLEQIVETLSGLSVLDLSKLKTLLEETWGVEAVAAAPVAMMAAPAAAAAEEVAEATEFTVTLEEVAADKRIGAIKVVRELTGLGLKEAKDIVEGCPKVIKEAVPKAAAEEAVKKLTEAGAKASMKGV